MTAKPSLRKTVKPVKQSGTLSRNFLVLFRVNAREKTRIEMEARRQGLTVSQMLRSLTLGLIVCIARSPVETTWTGDTLGHVSSGYGFVDVEREALLSCESDGEVCSTFCFESRGE